MTKIILMKTRILLFLFINSLIFLNTGCFKDQCNRTITYSVQHPIEMSPADFRQPVIFNSSKNLLNQGKIYFYNDLLLINELYKGIHLFDNTSPERPLNLGFIEIPGNVDMAIKNEILYADGYTDLLAIDIADITKPQLIQRTENVFPHFGETSQGKIIVAYETEIITEEVDCDSWNRDPRRFTSSLEATSSSWTSNSQNSGSNDVGIGGSLARFTIANNHLYTVDNNDLHLFDLGNEGTPQVGETLNIGWGIETIFPYDNKLFIGSQNGMEIYDIETPSAPNRLGGYSHFTSCDPVFVKDNYAYVTLRSGTTCNGSTINQLDLLDISNITNPRLLESFDMDNPHGLSIDGDNLFLCEGEHGLKVFDIEDPEELDRNRIEYLKSIHAVDVISVPGESNTLLVIGNDGLHQYNYDNPNRLRLLSTIPVSN